MILIESHGPIPPIKINYMNEEGIKVSARPILVLTWCFFIQGELDILYFTINKNYFNSYPIRFPYIPTDY